MPDHLQKRINSAEIISLDIFDTAILRVVPRPVDVFNIVMARFANRGQSSVNFYPQARFEAEAKARNQAWQAGHFEITLDEIYQTLLQHPLFNGTQIEILKELEISTELALARRNTFIHSLYRKALENGKRIFFLSDMYLPEPVVIQILQNCGYQHYESLLLSSTLKKTKAAGSLFEHLIANADCNPKSILHIGDNINSDIQMAQRHGLASYHYEKSLDKAVRLSELPKKQIKIIKKGIASIETKLYLGTILTQHTNIQSSPNAILEQQEFDFWYKFGYRTVGLLFLGFSRWLINKATTDNLERVYFLSRDGFILKQVYEILSEFNPKAPPAEYLYASRRALNIPSITTLDDHVMDFLVSGTSRLCVDQFIQRLGLNPSDFEVAICAVGFTNGRQRVISGHDYAQLRALYHQIFPEIQKIALTERINLHTYLDSIGLLAQKKIGMVDIGWHGTLQRSISRLLATEGKEIEIKGYYLGTFEKANSLIEEGYSINSYICHLGKPITLHHIIKLCVEVFEFIHTAPHGSVIRFDLTSHDKIEPVFDSADCNPERLAKAEALQQGALDFVRNSADIWSKLDFLQLPPEMAVEPLAQVLSNPSRQELLYLGDLEHAEGFGDVYVKRHLAKPPNIVKILKNPLELLYGYRNAFWRRGYCKRILSI